MVINDTVLLSLPGYLRRDIEALEKGREANSSVLDCLYNEVQGSINSAMWDREISKELADLLWETYL